MPRLSKIGAAALAAFGWTSGGAAVVTASYLVVAGGGGGGGGSGIFREGAGGGAGGLQANTTPLNTTLSYTVIVGAGGAGSTGDGSGTGVNGSNSQLGSLTASVGGGGGGNGATSGASGGSGGGAGGGAGSGWTGGSATSGQGNAGGNYSVSANTACGGGGAGAAGAVNTTNAGGAGGVGLTSSISGTSTYYAGGGGGSADQGTNAGAGGNGGGGAGGFGNTTTGGLGTAGTPNLGGGGGGSGANRTGANGGSGVVIISYPSPQKFGGGIVTTSGSNTIHTFQTSGTLSPLSTLSASYLIVAGGAGGSYDRGGGGGAGGYLTSAGLTIDTNSIYVVTVGSGGAGATTNANGSNGTNSTFSAYATASVGGGGGASYVTAGGSTGGSGGGGSYTNTGGSGTSGQGNAGGNGESSVYINGGGGGGAGAVGQTPASSANGGNGGAGLASSISGTSTYYAGGGGGGHDTRAGGSAGTGGTGGGGAGGMTGAGTAGTVNTGGGGGGGGNNGGSSPQVGGAGGSGIVIISYAGSVQQMAGGTVTISGGNVIHTFTSSGYLAPLKFVGNSLRFRASASAALSRTVTTASSGTKGTFSAWVKRGKDWDSNNNGNIVSAADSYNYGQFYQQGLYFGNTTNWMNTAAVYRDPAAWYHVFFAFDTTLATSTDRLQIWVNGVRQTAGGVTSYPTQNASFPFLTSAQTWYIGGRLNTNDLFYDGEMTEINFVDGQALTPNSFGTFNSYGVWQPITYGGSYGTNGFYLPMNPGSSTYNGSFNGSSQLISAPANAAFNFSGNFTAECWVNTSTITNATQPTLFTIGSDASGLVVGFYSGAFYCYMAGTGGLMSSATLPLNQWVHVAWVRVGSTNTLYLNGIASATATNSSALSSTGGVTVGKTGSSGSSFNYFQGYVSNFRVNNTALYTANFTPSTSPLTAVSGTQLLTLQNSTIIDNSTNAFTITNTGSVATTVAYPFNLNKTIDYGPAGNNWTNNNIGMVVGTTFDSMTDVPTLTSTTAANYAVSNPLDKGSSINLSNGNLQYDASGVVQQFSRSTIGVTGGKWYYEVVLTTIGNGNAEWGVANQNAVVTTYIGSDANGWGFAPQTSGSSYKYNSGSAIAYGSATGTGTYAVAIDADTGKVWFSDSSGAWISSGNPASGTNESFSGLTGTLFAAIGQYSGSSQTTQASINFGQQPFKYTPPSGFVALNTYNL